MADYLILSKEQIRQIDDIYIAIIRKYKCSAEESIRLDAIPRLTLDEASALAEFDIAEKRAKILTTYDERVADIHRNASARGLSSSTIVLLQLERAYNRKIEALARLDGLQDALSKKIFADNQKLSLYIEKEKSISRSRSLRDFIAVSKMRLTIPYDAQALIDEELYNAYLGWLLQFTPNDAYWYCSSNAIFYINMGSANWNRLLSTLNTRKEAQP